MAYSPGGRDDPTPLEVGNLVGIDGWESRARARFPTHITPQEESTMPGRKCVPTSPTWKAPSSGGKKQVTPIVAGTKAP